MTSEGPWACAACRGTSAELFFPVHETPAGAPPPSAGELAAITTCCLLRGACLEWALDAGEVEWGVLGGLKAADRAVLRRIRAGVAA